MKKIWTVFSLYLATSGLDMQTFALLYDESVFTLAREATFTSEQECIDWVFEAMKEHSLRGNTGVRYVIGAVYCLDNDTDF